MAFTSFGFLGFVLASLILYYLAPKGAQWMVLLAVSLSFYWLGGGRTILWLFGVIAVTYGSARLLSHQNALRKSTSKEDKSAQTAIKKRKKFIVTATLLACFGLLYAMKYLNFTLDILGIPGERPDFIMPLGLSFFIFQSTSYVIDVYRGKYEAQKNFFKFSLFVSFFPQMIQGPISRYDQLSQTLLTPQKLDFKSLQFGIQLAMWGYFKKMIIADRCAVLVNEVFVEHSPYGGSIVAFSVLFYSIQLYCDFSGGIDITRGVAQMFGIQMTKNFNAPIFATSLTDFWRRWHISLGAWMKDYLFYPLSLSKPFGKLAKWGRRHIKGRGGKMVATSLATFIVYFVIGIWHGANFRYITFGLYNGTLITLSLLMEARFQQWKTRLSIDDTTLGWRCFQMVRTWVIVFVGRYLTRAPRLLVTIELLKTTVLNFQPSQLVDGTLLSFALTPTDFTLIFLGVAAMLIIEWYGEFRGDVREALSRQHGLIQWICIVLPLATLLLFGIYREGYIASEFIYTQF